MTNKTTETSSDLMGSSNEINETQYIKDMKHDQLINCISPATCISGYQMTAVYWLVNTAESPGTLTLSALEFALHSDTI